MPTSVQLILTQDRAALESALSLDHGTARTEVQMLLGRALHVSRTYLLAHPEQTLDGAQVADYRTLLQRRLAGEPVAYILGEREFYGLTFTVAPATLIPRPETELLVELALQRILPFSRGLEATPGGEREGRREARVLDLGTGCGALALAIAHARPDVSCVAVDASPEALAVAQENARRLNIGNVRLLQGDWFSALAGECFDLIVSNPPYIANGDAHLAQGDLRFEPRAALVSGEDGLGDIRRIVAGARAHLNPGGWLLFEHGYEQAAPSRDLLRQAGFGVVFSSRDLAGIERVSGGRNLPERN